LTTPPNCSKKFEKFGGERIFQVGPEPFGIIFSKEEFLRKKEKATLWAVCPKCGHILWLSAESEEPCHNCGYKGSFGSTRSRPCTCGSGEPATNCSGPMGWECCG